MYIAYAMTDGHYRVSEKQLISRNKKYPIYYDLLS